MKTVLTYGTFDLFHVGHVCLLERARALGDRLVVGVSTDEFNLQKGKTNTFRYEDRIKILRSCRYVDDAFPETCWEQKELDVVTYSASAMVIGDDWRGKFDFLKDKCEVIYLPRTPLISTTLVKELVREAQANVVSK